MSDLSYRCPTCNSVLDICDPQQVGVQLRTPSQFDYRIKGGSSSHDEFTSGSVGGGEPWYLCWECESAFPRSICHVNHGDRQTSAAGER